MQIIRSIQFGECAVNERLDTTLRVENNTEDLAVPFEFRKIAHFKTDPAKDVLHPMSDRAIAVTFLPKNLGVFSSTIVLALVGGIYEVPIKLYGISRKVGQKPNPLRGPEAMKKDFEEERKYFQDEKARRQIERKAGESSIPRWLKESTTWQMEQSLKGNAMENIEDLARTDKKRNTFLEEARVAREQRTIRQQKMKNTAKKFPKSLEDYLNDPDLNLEEGRPPSPKMFLTATNDPLWVVKPIGKHEPAAIDTKRMIEYETMDSKRQYRKQPFDPRPKGEEQSAHCNAELTGEDLQKIAAGPITIDFGNLFVNSEEVRYFSVRNDLHQFVMVHLMETRDLQISPEQQVIPGGAIASFTLKFKSSTPQDYNRSVTYKINEKHTFNICVKAKVEPVKLDVYPPHLNFQFNYENLKRSVDADLEIRNPGNWPAKYTIKLDQIVPAFKISTPTDQDEFTIEKKDVHRIKVAYMPPEDSKGETAKITITVAYGSPVEVTCAGECPKGDCEVVDGKEIDFGELQVGDTMSEERLIKLRTNPTKEYKYSVVEVDTREIPELRLNNHENPFRLHSNDESGQLSFSLDCKEPKQIEGNVLFYVRGGKTQSAKVRANVIVPNVSIKEGDFDFGLVTSQGPQTKLMTLVNKSSIKATLIMILVDNRELSIVRPPGQAEKEGTLAVMAEEKKEAVGTACRAFTPGVAEDIDQEMSDDEDEEAPQEEEEEDRGKNYTIVVPPNAEFALLLKFTPDITNHERRKIPLPLEIKGVGKTNDIRRVSCDAKQGVGRDRGNEAAEDLARPGQAGLRAEGGDWRKALSHVQGPCRTSVLRSSGVADEPAGD